jgi:hypothetical protein
MFPADHLLARPALFLRLHCLCACVCSQVQLRHGKATNVEPSALHATSMLTICLPCLLVHLCCVCVCVCSQVRLRREKAMLSPLRYTKNLLLTIYLPCLLSFHLCCVHVLCVCVRVCVCLSTGAAAS